MITASSYAVWAIYVFLCWISFYRTLHTVQINPTGILSDFEVPPTPQATAFKSCPTPSHYFFLTLYLHHFVQILLQGPSHTFCAHYANVLCLLYPNYNTYFFNKLQSFPLTLSHLFRHSSLMHAYCLTLTGWCTDWQVPHISHHWLCTLLSYSSVLVFVCLCHWGEKSKNIMETGEMWNKINLWAGCYLQNGYLIKWIPCKHTKKLNG